MRLISQIRVPARALAITLKWLSLAQFEPLDLATDMCIALKMPFLFTITSLKKVGDGAHYGKKVPKVPTRVANNQQVDCGSCFYGL